MRPKPCSTYSTPGTTAAPRRSRSARPPLGCSEKSGRGQSSCPLLCRAYTRAYSMPSPVSGAGRAVRSWADLARQPQPLPSTLLDLLPSLIFDGLVILPVLELVCRLQLSEDRRPELLASVVRIAYGLHNTSFDGTDTVLAGCIEALRALSHGLPDDETEGPLGAALIVSDRLSPHDLRDVLRSPWPARLANSGAFAERALSVLASTELVDYFNSPNLDIQVALLDCPHGVGLRPLRGVHAGYGPSPA